MSNLLSIGKTGLDASRKSLATTGHNIANANTEGYSRQRVNQSTGLPISKDGLNVGTGARIRNINRIEAPHLVKNLEKSISNNEFNKETLLQLEQVQEIFNEIENEGLHKVLNKFFNSFRQLANQPENETLRSLVRESAKLVVKDFKRIRESLDTLSRNIDKKIDIEIADTNLVLSSLAKLNIKIATMEANGAETGDLRDQRDNGLRTLSENFKINSYLDNRKNFVVNAVGVGSLVAAGKSVELLVAGKSKEKSSNNMAGSKEIFIEGRPSVSISNKFKSGRIQALMEIRNKDIRQQQDKIDNIAFEFINSVNAIHKKGFINKKIPVDKEGNILPSGNEEKITGINFFKPTEDVHQASKYIDLSNDVKSDLKYVVTALNPNSPGDNRIAIAVSKLQYEKVMKEGTATLEEEFLQSIGKVGLHAGKARLENEQSEGLLAQTKALKERITGVSLDEEAANLIKYQHAYQASAKVLSTAEEMFNTLLSIKR